ncbi:ferredoxin [Gordonia terrae]
MRIRVDREKCCGFGTCTVIAPAVFDLRVDDNLAYPLVDEPGVEHHEVTRQAAEQCPTEAIVIAD